MPYANKVLLDEISTLPLEKIGVVLSFVRYLKQEAEAELVLTDIEYGEFYSRLSSDDFVSDEELAAKIEALPDEN